MNEKSFATALGDIHYWTNVWQAGRHTLVFLPGLTADHRLFDAQIEHFSRDWNVFVWDAPAHGRSRPFALGFSLSDKARWLREILAAEGVERPVLVGQSMGSYVAQSYLELFPDAAAGFVSIDSAPLQRSYYSAAELWLLKRMEPVYRAYPWRLLQSQGAAGCAETPYGQRLMKDMMSSFGKREYCRLAAHGYRILAEAVEARLPYRVSCPALLVCGDKDKAGSTRRYNRQWTKKEGFPIAWIANAGHNSNTDRPQEVNAAIERFAAGLQA